jgi:hypothetical protein
MKFIDVSVEFKVVNMIEVRELHYYSCFIVASDASITTVLLRRSQPLPPLLAHLQARPDRCFHTFSNWQSSILRRSDMQGQSPDLRSGISHCS